jgi:hypothetical protein
MNRNVNILPNQQQFMYQRWLAAPWDTDFLLAGHGLLPFAPSADARHELARRFRKEDHQLVDEILSTMIEVSESSTLLQYLTYL